MVQNQYLLKLSSINVICRNRKIQDLLSTYLIRKWNQFELYEKIESDNVSRLSQQTSMCKIRGDT